jgi:cadmium resistance protein CadD (predicted permease)
MRNIITSILAFVSTNIDDIFILMMFYASKKFSFSTIIAGQYIGIAVLVLISLVAAYVGTFVDPAIVGLLGLFPLYLGTKQMIDLFRKQVEQKEKDLPSTTFFAVAGVTIANGADNIGVYVPLLTTMTSYQKVEMLIVFGALTYLLCLGGRYLATHPLIGKQLDKYGHILMPIVLILLGIVIMVESGTFIMLGSLISGR